MQRHRGTLLTLAGGAAAVLVAGFVFLGATGKSYACSSQWQPEPTPSPSAGQSPRLGYVQPNMGRTHDDRRPQRYTYCPPATGTHINAAGRGPIEARLYGPEDRAEPNGWVHNLEHGGLVVLYKCEGDACEEAGQQRLRELFDTFPASPICAVPKGQIAPVIARFDEMAWPYAALVWGRVLPLESFDATQILEFYRTEGERTNPEPQCTPASPSPSPGASVGPSGSPGASASASPAASGSPAASASPAGPASPSASPVASPS
jgi:hypothetical protein